MWLRKMKTHFVMMTMIVSVAIILFTSTPDFFLANGTSIVMVNHYPVNGTTYNFVDYFLEQTTEINTNTTISLSIDSGPLMPLAYQGIRNEVVPGDTAARDWYTWTLYIPAITMPGFHTFQFFRHYYVWQQADQYWGEFNSHSPVMYFNIANSTTNSPSPTSTPSISPTPTSTPAFSATPSPSTTALPTPSPDPERTVPILTLAGIAVSAIVVASVLFMFALGKRR